MHLQKVQRWGTYRWRVCVVSLYATLLLGVVPVRGDEAPQSSSAKPEEAKLQEVIVTARRQSERLQDVPMSISTVGDEAIEKTGSLTLQDIGRQVAGLSVTSAAPGEEQFNIRGLPASLYLDDTPLIGQTTYGNVDPVLFDLARVEVLRGPQGTLYGEGSMGGVIRYVTNQPDLFATSGAVKVTASDTEGGGFNDEMDVLVNQPLISGSAAVRATAFYRDYNGYIDQYPTDPHNYLAVLPGPVSKDVNTDKTYGARILFEFKPVDALTVTPSVYYQRTDLGAPFTFDAPPGSFHNPIQSGLLAEPSTDEVGLYALTVKADVTNWLQVTSATSYFSRSFIDTEDSSKPVDYYFSPAPETYVYPVPLYYDLSASSFTEELRASGKVGPVQGLVGMFYTHQSTHIDWNWPTPAGYAAAFGNPFGGEPLFVGPQGGTDIQTAIFGEFTVDLVHDLQATIGARAFENNTHAYDAFAGVFFSGPPFSGKTEDHVVTPKYGLTYHFTPDILAYATATNGFREGTPTTQLPSTCNADFEAMGLTSQPPATTPDHVWSYEIGAKTNWLDDRLTLNVAAYDIVWTSIQQDVLLPHCGLTTLLNFGAASSKGGELELHYAAPMGLHLSLGVGYNDAKLTTTVPGEAQAGAPLLGFPEWAGNATVEYDRALAAETSGYARVDFNTTSYQVNNYATTSIFYKDAGYSLGNLRVGVTRKKWQWSLFVTNFLNKYAETALPNAQSVDLPTQRRYGLAMPRTIGVDARFDY